MTNPMQSRTITKALGEIENRKGSLTVPTTRKIINTTAAYTVITWTTSGLFSPLKKLSPLLDF
jgi:hypothetical protein